LAHAKFRNAARDAIHAALNRKGEEFKILFLVTLQAGRIVDQDVATMQMVLASTPDITVQYGVIINKLTAGEMKKYNANGVPENHMASLIACSDCGVRPKPEVWWIPRIDELEDAENMVVTLPRHLELIDWIATKVPTCTIKSEVKKIDVEKFDQLKTMLEDQIADLKANSTRLQDALEQANRARETEMERLSKQMESQRQEAAKREEAFRDEHKRELARQEDQRREAELREKESRKEERLRHDAAMQHMKEENERRQRESDARHAKEIREQQQKKDEADQSAYETHGLPVSLVIIEAYAQHEGLSGQILGGDSNSPWLHNDLGKGREITMRDGRRQRWSCTPASLRSGSAMQVEHIPDDVKVRMQAVEGVANFGVEFAGFNVGVNTLAGVAGLAASTMMKDISRLEVKYGHDKHSIRRQSRD